MKKELTKIYHNKRQLSKQIEKEIGSADDSKRKLKWGWSQNTIKYRCCILLVSIGLMLQMGKCIPIYAFSEIIDEELELIVPEQEHQQDAHTGKEQYKYEINDILSETSQSNNQSGNQSNKPSNNTQSDKGTAGTSQSSNNQSNNQSGNQSNKPSGSTQSDKGTAGTSQSSNNQSNNQSSNQSIKPSNSTQSDKGTAETSQPSNNQSNNQSSNQSNKPSGSTQSGKEPSGTSQSSNNQSNNQSSNQSNKLSGNAQSNSVHQENIQANNKNGSFSIDVSLKNEIEADSYNPISDDSFESILLDSQEQPYNKLRQKQLLQEKLTALDDTLNRIMTKNDALSVTENVRSELYGKNNYDIMSWSREFFSIAASVFFVLMFFISVSFWLIRKGREQ